MLTELAPAPEDWSVALAVAAHPDDLEYGTAAAVARWTGQAKKVAYCLVSSGEAGIDSLAPEEAGPLRENEQRAAAAVVGVDSVEFLGHPDGVLEHGLPLRRDIARAIRRHRPEMVLTANFRESWPWGGVNQADHVAVGRAVVDAVRDAANRWVFRELLDEGLAPWGGVRWVMAVGSPRSTHGVDVTDHLAAGATSMAAHATYLAGLGEHPMARPREFLERFTAGPGRLLGRPHAVPYELIDMGGPR